MDAESRLRNDGWIWWRLNGEGEQGVEGMKVGGGRGRSGMAGGMGEVAAGWEGIGGDRWGMELEGRRGNDGFGDPGGGGRYGTMRDSGRHGHKGEERHWVSGEGREGRDGRESVGMEVRRHVAGDRMQRWKSGTVGTGREEAMAWWGGTGGERQWLAREGQKGRDRRENRRMKGGFGIVGGGTWEQFGHVPCHIEKFGHVSCHVIYNQTAFLLS